jgi:hypothetical protein
MLSEISQSHKITYFLSFVKSEVGKECCENKRKTTRKVEGEAEKG